ncbi:MULTISPECIES: D-alanine--D-alanine ligase [Sphingobacterium]|jgi:D-alanine-D-alanine ligase|uniref:D-alanine--D-alanine ligase n=1 Tax=Sphingobacterium cellulitidis TaxID=1768011 RepID=A0A8H9G4F8_9SPHI|nr:MULTISPECIES: D-alanine--D-alanine ligase [Sphingobacterium]MBA8988710.1 D-alanine-D-alanine ligase [Sphingobacterium soli]OYD43263.1 D-alanine--D-alanine ligase A [Sphingobacterium cellulitidis]WFB62658.1 D-alanine--D-alanine ligase [Sphingobacterium sp. WM]GGE35539.1 D-alanine--D-alanine ligase [Sphingobacterium soli]
MKTKVALITGGYTGEAEISYKSSAFVYSQIDKEKYDVYPIDITLESWAYTDENGQKHEINRQDFSLTIHNETLHFDVAFIILHGTPGEDGRLQGYLDMIGLPYTSCGALTSSLTMNKGYTKAIIQDIPQLKVAKSVLLFDIDRANAFELVKSKLNLPLFVKPNAGGSSIGMNKVNTWEELPKALDEAYDAEGTGMQVLVEEFVKGREFSQGIFRDSKGNLQVLPATEVITTREFFDFEAKYTPGLTQEITPADLTAEQKSKADEIIKEVYVRLNCKGMVRVDFFIQNETDEFYFIEINTIPGQTAQSFIPQQVRADGRTETKFYGELIEAAKNH